MRGYAVIDFCMRVLLLGSSGLLGHNVLQRLVADGHEVVALVRRADAIRLPVNGFEVKIGSLCDAATLTEAAAGCDAIVNCAGVTDMSLLHREDYEEVNCRLCEHIIEVAKHHGIKTLVHTSTVNTIGYCTPTGPADESTPMMPPFTESFYATSKCKGEKIMLDYAREHDGEVHVVVINPGYMIGSMDVKPSSGRLLLAGYRRGLMVAPSGGKACVHVGDVACAVVNALTLGKNGERYIVVGSDGHLSIKQLYQLQARVMGYRQRVITLPDWMLGAAGRVGDAMRALGIRTELSTRNVRQLMVSENYTNHHAINDLRITDTPIEVAIKDFYKWRETQ